MVTQFFNSIGACTVLALMATAFILRLNHAPASQPVPRYLECIRDCIACPLCMRRESPQQRVDINFDDILLAESQVYQSIHTYPLTRKCQFNHARFGVDTHRQAYTCLK
jgi:hypothetical protein